MTPRLIPIVLAVSLAAAVLPLAAQPAENEQVLLALFSELSEGALRSDPAVAARLYDDRLVLTSQSGKVYGKHDALLDLRNAFEVYRNEDFRFLHLDADTVVVNYRNVRKRQGMEESAFRVTAVWRRTPDGWRIVALHSSRIG